MGQFSVGVNSDLQAAKADRDRRAAVAPAVAAGVSSFRAQFEQHKADQAAKLQALQAERHRLDQERRQAEQAAEIKRQAQAQIHAPAKPERDTGHSR